MSEGGCLPMSMWDRGTAAFAAPGAAAQARHLGRGPGLVDEDQPLGFQIGLGLEPGPPTTHNVSPLLFAGVRGFF